MLKKFKLTIVAAIALVAVAAPALAAVPVSAQQTPQIEESLCRGSALQFGGDADCDTSTGDAEEGLNELIAEIVNIFSVIVAIVAVIMIIVGGFKYITSGGDSNKVGGAKNTIIYAIIGLVIVALAQFVVKFVLSKATGLTD